MSTPTAPQLDPAVLARARRLEFVARRTADALLAGHHKSRRVGEAVEFAEHIDYVPGMDPRFLDWRASARRERWVVRRHQRETEVPVHVVLDASGDMGTGRCAKLHDPALGQDKLTYASALAASLLWLLHRQGEPIGWSLLGAQPQMKPARRGRDSWHQALFALSARRAEGKADLGAALDQIGRTIHRHCAIFVLTDGMEELTSWQGSLHTLAKRGADVRFVHLWDRAELRLEGFYDGHFFSPEGGEALPVDASRVRERFVAEVGVWMAEVRAAVIAAGGSWVNAPTDRSLFSVLQTLLGGRTDAPESL